MDNVTIYPNSTILGGETVIGANVFLLHSIPPNSLVGMSSCLFFLISMGRNVK